MDRQSDFRAPGGDFQEETAYQIEHFNEVKAAN